MDTRPEINDRWTGFYKVAGIFSLLIVLVGLVDIVTSMLGGEAHANATILIEDWFAFFDTNPLAALGNLGLFNILTLSLGIPLYLALFNINKLKYPAFSALAAILFSMGTAIYISSNTVFSMQAISNQYAFASEVQKPLLEATGRALLAQGADLSAGTFMGFLFTQSAGLIMALVLMQSGVFGKIVPLLGAIGFGLMLVFFLIAAFAPEHFNTATMISAPGGILLMAYQVLLARKLFQLSK
jgi:hypothetical protein